MRSADEDVVAPGELGGDAHLPQRGDHDRGAFREALRSGEPPEARDGVVEVAEVVVDRAAAGHAAHDRDAEFADRVGVDLGECVLVAPDDDRGPVAPEHHEFAVVFGGEQLLQREVVRRIVRSVDEEFHVVSPRKKSFPKRA